VFAIHMAWFEGELVLWRVYCRFYLSLAFSSYSPKSLASHVILACICLNMLITVLG
jgi:hypothetical protein